MRECGLYIIDTPHPARDIIELTSIHSKNCARAASFPLPSLPPPRIQGNQSNHRPEREIEHGRIPPTLYRPVGKCDRERAAKHEERRDTDYVLDAFTVALAYWTIKSWWDTPVFNLTFWAVIGLI